MKAALIYFAIVNLLLVIKLGWDWYSKNKKKRIINHGRSVVADGVVYVLSSYFLFCAPDWCSLFFMFGVLFISAGYRWVFFDIIFNLINGDKWDHYGNSSKFDLFMIKLRDGWSIKILKKQVTIRLGKWVILAKAIPIIIGTILVLL